MGKNLTTAHDPQAIGALFRKAHASHADSIKHLAECGTRLRAIKETLDHGSWQLWLREHQQELGFCDRTAQRLMRAAYEMSKPTSTSVLESVQNTPNPFKNDEAARISRGIWGNDPAPKVELEIHGPEYRQLVRMIFWMRAHPSWTVNSSLSREEAAEIRGSIAEAKEWFTSLENAVTALPGSNGWVIENKRT